jgi:peptidyl-prolyl cis-trans isomerase D
MFDFVAKHKRVAQIFLGLIAITFATWGIESYTRLRSSGDAVAVVNGSEITQREFAEALNAQQERVRQMFGGKIDPLQTDTPEMRKQLVDQMVDRRVVVSEAARRNLIMSRAAVIEAITQAPDFQDNGQFSADKYAAYLASRNTSDQRYVQELQSDLPLGRLVNSVAATAIAPRSVIVRLGALEAQRREVAELRIPAQQFLSQAAVDAGQAKAYYDAHPDEFQIPERVRAEYLVLSAEQLARSEPVSDAEIRAGYEAQAAKYRVDEERRASHILVKTRAEADKVLAELKKSPGQFAELAKKLSQDPGSAAKGGDLGWFGRGIMVKPFEEAAFAMKPNEMRLVESEFGFHVLRLTGVQGAKAKSYDEVKKEIAVELARQKGAKKYAEAAENFSNMVYEQPDSLKPAAERFKLQVQSTGWIARTQAQELGALDNPKLIAALFSSDGIKNRRNTDAVEVAPNTLVAARVIEHQPAAQRKFEEAKDEITDFLRRRAAVDLARKDGEAKLERLRKGDDAGIKWGTPRSVSRRDAQGVQSDVLRQIVAADVSKLPAYVGIPFPDGYLVVRISKVIEADNKVPDLQATQRVNQLYGAAQFQAYVAALRARADVEIKPAALEKK